MTEPCISNHPTTHKKLHPFAYPAAEQHKPTCHLKDKHFPHRRYFVTKPKSGSWSPAATSASTDSNQIQHKEHRTIGNCMERKSRYNILKDQPIYSQSSIITQSSLYPLPPDRLFMIRETQIASSQLISSSYIANNIVNSRQIVSNERK